MEACQEMCFHKRLSQQVIASIGTKTTLPFLTSGNEKFWMSHNGNDAESQQQMIIIYFTSFHDTIIDNFWKKNYSGNANIIFIIKKELANKILAIICKNLSLSLLVIACELKHYETGGFLIPNMKCFNRNIIIPCEVIVPYHASTFHTC